MHTFYATASMQLRGVVFRVDRINESLTSTGFHRHHAPGARLKRIRESRAEQFDDCAGDKVLREALPIFAPARPQRTLRSNAETTPGATNA
jgi:hypothetical protein